MYTCNHIALCEGSKRTSTMRTFLGQLARSALYVIEVNRGTVLFMVKARLTRDDEAHSAIKIMGLAVPLSRLYSHWPKRRAISPVRIIIYE
jgi:hypothetical protein